MSTPTPTSLPDNQEESQLKQVFTKTAHSTDVKENTQEVDQFTQIFITAAGELFKYIKPSKEAVQQIHNHRNDLAQAIYKGTLPLLKELSDTSRYKEEEVVSSDFKYHSRYKKSKSIVRQLKILDRIFPGLLFDKKRFFFGDIRRTARHLESNREAQEHSEGCFVIPRWRMLAPTYAGAVQMLFEAISRTQKGKFYNHCSGLIVNENLHQSEKTKRNFDTIIKRQLSGKVFTIEAQLGLRHCGRSPRRVLEVMEENEFGLDVFTVGIMLLTHPERLQHKNNPAISCIGDQIDNLNPDALFNHVPVYSFLNGRIEFNSGYTTNFNRNLSSASAFNVQQS